MIDSKAKQILESTFWDVLALMKQPPLPYTFVYEEIGGRFKTMDNAEEVSIAEMKMYINEDWANKMVKDYEYDLYYMMAHEARHVYQQIQISQLRSGRQYTETPALIVSWEDNFLHYQRNEGGDTVKPYHRQPVEVDADAFANLYVLLKGIGQARISDDADELVTQRLKEIATQYNLEIR